MSAGHSIHGKEAPYYYVPPDSPHPVRASLSLLIVMLGASAWVNGVEGGKWAVLLGLLGLIVVLYYWFGDAIHEEQIGLNSKRIDVSYRWSMSWFIFSEVMFLPHFLVPSGTPVPSRHHGWVTWITDCCCGLIFHPPGPTLGLLASSSHSKPWGRSGCRPSIRHCCWPQV